MKYNFFPKGIVPLERLFNSNDVVVDLGKIFQDEHIQDQNIGTRENSRLVKLYVGLPPNFQERYIKLFKNYVDVFAWSYEGLKTYDVNIIQYKIPLKEGLNPTKISLGR